MEKQVCDYLFKGTPWGTAEMSTPSRPTPYWRISLACLAFLSKLLSRVVMRGTSTWAAPMWLASSVLWHLRICVHKGAGYSKSRYGTNALQRVLQWLYLWLILHHSLQLGWVLFARLLIKQFVLVHIVSYHCAWPGLDWRSKFVECIGSEIQKIGWEVVSLTCTPWSAWQASWV